ncbi:hypothetical protein HY414_00825 [Candidatus Kaiserbacteria bacterium]|nr:hypothetical protein [Candidatus Kaiserbacteria bacterium]
MNTSKENASKGSNQDKRTYTVGGALIDASTWIGKGDIRDPLVKDIITSCTEMRSLDLGLMTKKEVASRSDEEIGEFARQLIASFPPAVVGRLVKEIVQDYPEEDVGRLVKGRAIVRIKNINK